MECGSLLPLWYAAACRGRAAGKPAEIQSCDKSQHSKTQDAAT